MCKLCINRPRTSRVQGMLSNSHTSHSQAIYAFLTPRSDLVVPVLARLANVTWKLADQNNHTRWKWIGDRRGIMAIITTEGNSMRLINDRLRNAARRDRRILQNLVIARTADGSALSLVKRGRTCELCNYILSGNRSTNPPEEGPRYRSMSIENKSIRAFHLRARLEYEFTFVYPRCFASHAQPRQMADRFRL